MEADEIYWTDLKLSEAGIVKAVQSKVPLEKHPFFRLRSLPLTSEDGIKKEVGVIRGKIITHQVSVAMAYSGRIKRTMALSITMKIGDIKETHIIMSNIFEDIMIFNNFDTFDIIVVERMMIIVKSK